MKAMLGAMALIPAMAAAAPAPNAPSTMAPNIAPTIAPNATVPTAAPQVIAPIDLKPRLAVPTLCLAPETAIIGEKGRDSIIGEKGSEAVIGEKSADDGSKGTC